MLTNTDLLIIAKWMGITTILCGALTTIAFLLKWGFRFRLVGVTSFLGVLTGGLVALGWGLYTRTEIPGAVHYTLVYENGGAQTVVAVPPNITPSELTATMQQAGADLYSPGRLGSGKNEMTVRVRTIIHPEEGVSQPLYLGEVKRALNQRDAQIDIKTFPQAIAKLPKANS
ncbi:MAG: Ycf51 family protein [Microcoleaceae cyanobacterium]